MATIIDRLVMEMGLDPKAYIDGQKKVGEANKRLSENVRGQSRDMEGYSKRAKEVFGSLRSEVTGLVLAFAGAASVKGFVQNILTGDAATGRFANSINMATQDVSAWELALQSVGGTAADARGALGMLSDAFQKAKLTGSTGKDQEFARLGITNRDDLRDPQEALLKLADAKDKLGLDNATYTSRLRDLGISPDMINLLLKGRGELSKLIAEKERDAAASAENARQSAELEAKIADLVAKIKANARPAIYGMVGALEKADDQIGLVNVAVPILTGALGALALAALAAAGPWVALAAAIAAAVAAYQHWRDIKNLAKVHSTGGTTRAQNSSAFRRFWNDPLSLFRVHDEPHGRPPGQPTIPPGAVGAGPGGPVKTAGLDPELFAFFKAKYGDARAAGIVAGIMAESGGNPAASNSDGGGQGAYGIGQWRGARLERLKRRYPGSWRTKRAQMEFLAWELEGGDAGGASVLASKNAEDTLSNYVGGYGWGFMRPDRKGETRGREGDMARGRAALGLARAPGRLASRGGNVTVTNTMSVGQVVVNAPNATDAKGIAAELPGAIAARGLIAQANRGLD